MLLVNDSSGTIRVIFWFNQNITNEVNLIGSIARDNPVLIHILNNMFLCF